LLKAVCARKVVLMRLLIPLTIVWLALLFALFVFTAPLADLLFLLFPMLLMVFFVTGSLLAIVAVVTAKRDWRRTAAVLGILALAGWLYASNVGFRWGRVVLFQIRKPTYVRQLAQAEKLGHVPDEFGCTDLGPPVIHGLYWQRGILDNYSLVVYDPSGRIAEINRMEDWDAIHTNQLSDLFGGTYYTCQDMGGGWYICWFT
jgi:hypothetical protein